MKTILEKKLINFFIDNRSYLVDNLQDNESSKEIWFIYKNDNYNHIVFFANGNDYNEILKNALIYIDSNKNKLKNINFEFVVLTNYPQNITVSADITNIPYIENMSFIIVDTEKLELSYAYGKSNIINDINDIVHYEKNKKNSRGFSKAPITYSIIIINIIVYFMMSMYDNNLFLIDTNTLVAFGAKANYLIERGQYYRIITSMFLHGGILHLASNMYSLLMLGVFLERVYGKNRYILIYMISGISGSILSFALSESISVGASGAIFGLLGAALVYGLEIRDRIGKEFVFNIIQVIAINIIIGLNIKYIDKFAHIGGLIGGIIVAVLLSLKD
ncbi:rhomboid family intramembrane serine protease [Clostridium oryzae]|uniref:Rhomboid protease GluP n=1 Tax=Clostridium oryzae TaxID=1450648 RepID=A0A1V4IGM5_9CLOT|nr:rhomboid family intramembrane serine protease [Clostridium oryzae]OPJ59000.1 rhomboid protease GluP [Clostridium oryzae]